MKLYRKYSFILFVLLITCCMCSQKSIIKNDTLKVTIMKGEITNDKHKVTIIKGEIKIVNRYFDDSLEIGKCKIIGIEYDSRLDELSAATTVIITNDSIKDVFRKFFKGSNFEMIVPSGKLTIGVGTDESKRVYLKGLDVKSNEVIELYVKSSANYSE
jgi:hypothetical protein